MRRERARPDRGRVGFRGGAGGPRVRRPEPRTETRAVRFRRRFRDAGGVVPALERDVQLPRARGHRREETFGLGHLDGRVASRRGQQLPSRSRALVHRARRERLPGKMDLSSTPRDRRRGTPCSRALRVPAPSVDNVMWAPREKNRCKGRAFFLRLAGPRSTVFASIATAATFRPRPRCAMRRATRRTSCHARWS